MFTKFQEASVSYASMGILFNCGIISKPKTIIQSEKSNQIFCCSAANDKEIVKLIQKRFLRFGYSVEISEQIGNADNLNHVINLIGDAKVVVFAVSEHASEDACCRLLIEYSTQNSIPIVSVSIDNKELLTGYFSRKLKLLPSKSNSSNLELI
eukprot:c13126_g1_i2.p1 GENE.c13126_g1_i2~~c13126_g1_i2.p1  ORF type:complete len:153 (+),score=65.39 c13126_g1_i2:41-499(+)